MKPAGCPHETHGRQPGSIHYCALKEFQRNCKKASHIFLTSPSHFCY